MDICLNNDFEGNIIEIPGIEQDPNEFFFKYRSNYEDYIIGINLDYNKNKIIISIAFKNINKIVIRKVFTYEGIEKFDPEFFIPFKGNILILFKFITRLLLANLIDFVTTKKENKNLYYLILNCLKDNSIRPIKIDLNNNFVKEIIIDRNPEDKNNKKAIKFKINDKDKTNQEYKIALKIIEHKYQNSEIYKEIEIKFTNEIDHQVYYDYLNSQDIFDRPIPYYQLFNNSIEDVLDDLNIIIRHNNYYYEEHNQYIKLFFHVFNIKKSSTEPLFPIFIEKSLKRERTYNEFQSKMKEYFQNKLNMAQHLEKIENIDEQSEEKAKKKSIKIKKEIKNNSQISFMKNFLNMNKNLNSNNDENKNNNPIKNENNEQEIQSQSNNKYNNIEKNELIKPIFIIKEPNIKNNTNNNFKSNLLEQEYKTSKGDSYFMNRKRNMDLKLDMFFEKTKKIEENKLSENKEVILNNNENNNINNKNDNYPLENKEKKSKNEKKDKKKDKKENKKENKKLNIDKFKKEENKKSSDINMSFKLNKKGCYNIKKSEVMKAYLNLLYIHPLDNNDEYIVIENKEGKKFYLCKICQKFFNSRYLVRKHQWSIHLKPFREFIQKELKSQDKNKI